MLETIGSSLWSAVEAIVSTITAPDRRSYWPFLLLSLALAFSALAFRTRSARDSAAALFSLSLWGHRSALMDLRLIAASAFIKALLFAPITLSALAAVIAVIGALTLVLGPMGPPATSLSPLQISMIYTVVLFVSWDLSRYLLHRLMHQVPALWELHKVHHSAEVLTPFTVYRFHPLESFLYGLRGALTTGVVTGFFCYSFGAEVVQYTFLGANAIGMVFNAAGANLRHSPVWISYGRFAERLLISPAQHQIHHSRDPDDFDSNYGAFLAVWDWMAGSLRLAGRERPLAFGLTHDALNHDPARVGSAIVGPVKSMVPRLFGRGRDRHSHPPDTHDCPLPL